MISRIIGFVLTNKAAATANSISPTEKKSVRYEKPNTGSNSFKIRPLPKLLINLTKPVMKKIAEADATKYPTQRELPRLSTVDFLEVSMAEFHRTLTKKKHARQHFS